MSTPTPRAAPSTASGLLLVDKRGEWTSHDLVARTRRLAGTRKVGHAGTLDPMATGLMILGVNSSTRLLTYLVGLDKEYLATIRLGRATTTDDREGEVVSRAEPGRIRDLAVADVERAISGLRGVISQVPSAVSAIKVDGKRAYARVRAGEEVELAAREVTVSAFDVLRFDAVAPEEGEEDGAQLDLDVRITCSSGTYVRALARDLGASWASAATSRPSAGRASGRSTSTTRSPSTTSSSPTGSSRRPTPPAASSTCSTSPSRRPSTSGTASG
ncbi:tRNA pseudouridine synthase B [Clavibacter michiganensis]|uniref:tRNA pseudouridine synthase B n=1 Tax=Clavibacter michiganensis TaxID=28447 RepID=A0A251XW43_9MICO|nr:tRNA pseudouridine synthase B [Clavibacter michiganensis]